MVTFSIRESKDSDVKTVVTVECEVKDLDKYWTPDEVNDWKKYGCVVAMQAIGRGDVPALEGHLKRHSVEYVIEENVPVEKGDSAEKALAKAMKKFGPEKVMELIAKMSAK
jgi:hypothetical protein